MLCRTLVLRKHCAVRGAFLPLSVTKRAHRLGGNKMLTAWMSTAALTVSLLSVSGGHADARRYAIADANPDAITDISAKRKKNVAPPPTPSPSPSPTGPISSVWANDGADKVTQDELRTYTGGRAVLNRTWNGSKVQLFGARNEVVSFNLVLEAATVSAVGVTVTFNSLVGPGGFRIAAQSITDKNQLFSWVTRDIELFLVRYLPIRGLSRLSYDTYDERHVPERLRRPIRADGLASGGWTDRPDHDKLYPDIAVPMELIPDFSIAAGQNQSVWVDIYVPKEAPPGIYSGEVIVRQGGVLSHRIPVEFQVRDFILPDLPNSKTMVATSYHDVARRYTGIEYPAPNTPEDKLSKLVMDRQFLLAHRHKISLIDDNAGASAWPQDRPRPEWEGRLSGALFTTANGYKGPGIGVGNNVYSIGTYGVWHHWWGTTRSAIWGYSDKWESWFRQNAPDTDRFLYLIDESEDYAQTEEWASWMKANPGVGSNLMSFATADILNAQKFVPSLDIVASWMTVGDTIPWQSAADLVKSDGRKRFYLYNGVRPASGSFAIEDDGVALRELAWGQHKKGIDRWFFWEATYYNNYQGGRGDTNVFKDAQTFGASPYRHSILGMTSWNYSNGDGVLFYPGTDKVFPAESYDLAGPIASLRLKHWRRGIQDVDYISLAARINPQAVAGIVERMVPKVLWENGVSDPDDPTWVLAPISWSTDPDQWEAAREELANIIEGRY